MKRASYLIAVVFVTAIAAGCTAPGRGIAPDTIWVNGTVVTMEGERVVQAVAVLGDLIVAVGSDATVRGLAGPETRVVDLDGRTMTPGFYAAHDHFPGSGRVAVTQVDLNSPPIGGIENMDQLVAALRARAEELPEGQWVSGRGYDDTLLAEQRHPTRTDLDKASTTHPIYISHTSGHLGVANSLALELAGVTRDTPDPPGGVVRKDPDTGEPDGVFEESGGMVSRLIPPPTPEQTMEAYRWAVEDYVEDGVTTAVIAGGGRGSLAGLQRARDAGILTFRIITMMSRGAPGQPSAAEAGGMVSGFGDEYLKLGAIKIVQDGSNQGYTGYFTEPYHTPFKGDADYRGYPRRRREDLTTMVKELHETGYQIAIHANGDAAIDDVLHAFREAQLAFPREDARHRIEHCQMVRQDQLDAIAELNLSPSFFVGHVYYWGDRHRDIFMGPKRAAGISALRSSIDRGIRFTVHDDTPVTPVNPLQLVWVGVNRLTKTDQVLGPDERITPLEALRTVTIDAAWQNFEEDIKGSIAPGKLADLVILDGNPLTVDPTAIRDIQVQETIVGGETVYERSM
ncbi:MAG: amidohydrolase [Vicinamibacterales bacterium]|jgi:predicted amidohydrolase YtcJ|nr:amidohydrolase [Vicinamibacterales bacterium]RTZ99940.1 MAG: amidohydrolase [Candidatus Neomarinimicrobiota bacterium]